MASVYPRAGAPLVGGCKDCTAVSVPTVLRPGAFAMVTQHSDTSCPTYKRIIARLEEGLAMLADAPFQER